MPKGSLFWNMMAKTYAKSPVGNEEAYQEKLRLTREYMDADSEVLEFACGTGTTALTHAPRVKHIQAIDFSSKMIAICQAKAEAAGIKNVSFQTAGIDDWQVPDGTYDIVMGHSILHLLPNWRAVIPRIHAMLKPGGIFVSGTACMAGMGGVLRFLLPIGGAIRVLPPVQFFTVDELTGTMTGAGFEIEKQWQPEGSDAVFIIARKPG